MLIYNYLLLISILYYYVFLLLLDCFNEDPKPDLFEAILDRLNQSVCKELLKEYKKLQFDPRTEFCASKKVNLLVCYILFL